MSAPLRPSRDRLARAFAALLDVTMKHHGNREDLRAGAARDAFAAGRAAFWTRAKYHNQTACRFVLTANEAGVAAALATHADPSHPARSAAALLATLVPLNGGGAGVATPIAQSSLDRWSSSGGHSRIRGSSQVPEAIPRSISERRNAP